MARNLPPFTWANGFQESLTPSTQPTWADQQYYTDIDGTKAHYTPPQQDLRATTSMGTALGVEQLPGWPEIYDGTLGKVSKARNGESNGNGSNDGVEGEKTSEKVDVLICGAGPFGLELAVCLARAGVSFRIIDKASAPTLTGRADGVQPRALEHLHSWGLISEFTEEGPLLNSTVLFRNGVKLFHGFSSMCDSRYKGIHVITQGQIEKVYIRDLKRAGVLVEREVIVDNFKVHEKAEDGEEKDIHPVKAELHNIHTGRTESVHAKYLIGADGASSMTREMMGIPFDGVTTDCYWAIMDCQFKTDFPHILGFCIIISEEHGGVIIIPREDGYTRFYTQITGEKARQLSAARSSRRNASDVGATRIDDHGITADEVLEQLNKIMTPWKVEFASAMSWFAVWRVNERVARSFSSPDQRVHIGGDAAHVHSVLGAFGLNSSIYDAANLSWKLSLSILGHARPEVLLPTYDSERRLFANRVIRASGAYLRFIGNMKQPLAQLRGLGDDLEVHKEDLPILDGSTEADQSFMRSFFARNAHFLLGVESPIVESAICPSSPSFTDESPVSKSTSLCNGVRIPNPRVCFSLSETGYLYDKMTGVARFHILLFASDMLGPVQMHLVEFAKAAFGVGGFHANYGGADRFNVVLITKLAPDVADTLLKSGPELEMLMRVVTMVYDDRAPDEDAHYWFGVNHARGCVVVGRPDLRVGVSAVLNEGAGVVGGYLGGFLVDDGRGEVGGMGTP